MTAWITLPPSVAPAIGSRARGRDWQFQLTKPKTKVNRSVHHQPSLRKKEVAEHIKQCILGADHAGMRNAMDSVTAQIHCTMGSESRVDTKQNVT
eukprot:411425-Amphidinium_carterae.1